MTPTPTYDRLGKRAADALRDLRLGFGHALEAARAGIDLGADIFEPIASELFELELAVGELEDLHHSDEEEVKVRVLDVTRICEALEELTGLELFETTADDGSFSELHVDRILASLKVWSDKQDATKTAARGQIDALADLLRDKANDLQTVDL